MLKSSVLKLHSQLFEMRLKGDYSDRFGLTEDDVVPKIQPTEDFIKRITSMAKEKLGYGPDIAPL